MSQVDVLLQRALELHDAGKIPEAAAAYERALVANPKNANTWYATGTLFLEVGRLQDAIRYMEQAIRLDPKVPEFHSDLAAAYITARKGDVAETLSRRAISLAPKFADGYVNLASALFLQGKNADALVACERGIKLQSSNPVLQLVYGNILRALDRKSDAILAWKKVIEVNPNEARAWRFLCQLAYQEKKWDEALQFGRRALALDNADAETMKFIASAAENLGHYDVAVQSIKLALKHETNDPEMLGLIGVSLWHLGEYADAAKYLRRGIDMTPNVASFWHNLGAVMKDTGFPQTAVECFMQSRRLAPDYPESFSNQLFCCQYLPRHTLASLAELHREYSETFAAPLRAAHRPHVNSREPERRLRVGFICGDFHEHPVGRLTVAGLEELARGGFEIACYSNGPRFDSLSRRFKDCSWQFRDIAGQPDADVAEIIRQDEIDILVDLAGHTARNRILVMARKPAPVQMTWLGYPGTTGLEEIDYLLCDEFHLPTGCDQHFSEEIVRMPGAHIVFEPPVSSPDVGPVPSETHGQITFGSFNNSSKLTPEVVATWSRILHAVPNSRLILQYRGMTNSLVKDHFINLFTEQGIDISRVEIRGWADFEKMLLEYHEIDIALDPFPFTGGMTSFYAMWMGVPVITLEGETYASRQTSAYQRQMGITELIAATHDEYVKIASELAIDVPRMRRLRSEMRPALLNSPLCDAPRFANELGGVLRQIWRRWCEAGVDTADVASVPARMCVEHPRTQVTGTCSATST